MSVVDTTIPAFLDRTKEVPLVFTYTMMNTYANVCPHQAFRKYVKKDVPYKATPAMDYGNKVHEAFEFRIGAGKPLPVEMQQWEQFAKPFDGKNAKTEIKLAITEKGQPTGYFDKGVCLRGKVDAFCFNGPVGFLADWKTGGSRYEDPFELEVGALLLKVKYPNLKTVRGAYVWLKEDRMGQVYDLSDFAKTWAKISDIRQRMITDRASGQWEKRKSGLCGWCNVADCENWYEAKK